MPGKIPDKLVIDTNLWISFLINNSYPRLDSLVEKGKVKFLFSDELLTEFLHVIARPKFKKYFLQSDINQLLSSIHNHADFIYVISKPEICRDKKDNFILALCEDGKADFLLTGDEDLLSLKKYKKTRILKLQEYLKTV